MSRPHARRCAPDPLRLWRDIEEHLAPAFSLWASERVLVFYLTRISRLAGQRVVRVAARTMARATQLSRSTVRIVLGRLAAKGILRILDRSYRGLRVEIKLPHEIPGCVAPRLPDGRRLDALDFWTSKRRRALIFRRDGGECFYCLRRLRADKRVLDHVVPRARIGANSYRNLAACCSDCNMAKRDGAAEDHLRSLYRDGRLSAAELAGRLAALRALAQGRLKPPLTA